MQTDHTIDKPFIRRLISILDHNLDNERFGVSELAEAANVSRSQLHRKVHAYNGNSTSQFIRKYRLNKAKEMLQSNGQTVAEVAYSVGFSSPTYFNTCFKELYGFSPGEAKYHETKLKPKAGLRNKVLIWSFSFIALLILGYGFFYSSSDKDAAELINSIAISETSIAVLPISNWSGDSELEYISDGMTDAIITRLSALGPEINVIPFQSVLKYKGSDESAPAIAKELGVRNILRGSLQRSGDQMKISLQMIDGTNNRHFWSEDFSGKWNTDDIFMIQAQVAENVASKMNIKIDEFAAIAINKKPTHSKEAYMYWLKANFYGFQYTREGMKNAVPLYEKAISLDPTFFEAYVRLAYLYLFGGASWGMYDEQEAWYKAKKLLLKAHEIDSTNLKVKAALTDGLYLYEWDFKTMEENYRGLSNISIVYNLQTGRFDEAMSIIDKGLEEDPASMFYNLFRAQTLYFQGREEEAGRLLKISGDFYSDQIMFLRIASRFNFYLGNYERSKFHLNKLVMNFPDRPPVVLWLNAVNAFKEGDRDREMEYLGQLKQRYKDRKSGSPAWFTALYYNIIGEKEASLKWLDKSLQRHEVELIWLREEPALRSLRDEPGYKELYRKVGFPMPPHQTFEHKDGFMFPDSNSSL